MNYNQTQKSEHLLVYSSQITLFFIRNLSRNHLSHRSKTLLTLFFAKKNGAFFYFYCNYPITCPSYVTNEVQKKMTITEYNLAVDEYSDRLYRFVLKSIKDAHAAQDIVQDSYEKLWKNHENVEGKKVKSYLFYHGLPHDDRPHTQGKTFGVC